MDFRNYCCIYAIRINGKRVVLDDPVDKKDKIFVKVGKSANLFDRFKKHMKTYGDDADIMYHKPVDYNARARAENILLSKLWLYLVDCRVNGKVQKEIIMFHKDSIDNIKQIYKEVLDSLKEDVILVKDKSKVITEINNSVLSNGYIYGKIWNIDIIVMKKNGYINAAKLCNRYNKRFADWPVLTRSHQYIKYISKELNIPINELIIVIKRDINYVTGTYVHPKLIFEIMSWCSLDLLSQSSNILWEHYEKTNPISIEESIQTHEYKSLYDDSDDDYIDLEPKNTNDQSDGEDEYVVKNKSSKSTSKKSIYAKNQIEV